MTVNSSVRPPLSDRNNFLVPGAFLAAYVAAAKAADLSPVYYLKRAHLPTRDFENEQVVAPYARFMEVLDASAEAAGEPDFALSVVERLNLSSFGAVGILASAQPTLRDALRALSELSGGARRRMRATLEIREGGAAIRYTAKGELPWPSLRGSEVVLGFTLRLIQGLIGDDWRPRLTTFRAATPADEVPYEQLFGEVAFDQPFDALEIDVGDLERSLPSANPSLARLATQHLAAHVEIAERVFDEEVRHLITALLPRGICTIDLVATHLGVDRRTVHRRLGGCGVTFSEVVQAVRRELAEARLAEPGISVSDLAQALGFSGAPAFSRWFRDTFGASPRQFRRAA